MKTVRRLILATYCLIGSVVAWLLIGLVTVAISVGAGTAFSIPFVFTNTVGEGGDLATTNLEFPGVLVAVLLLATLIFGVLLMVDRASDRDSPS